MIYFVYFFNIRNVYVLVFFIKKVYGGGNFNEFLVSKNGYLNLNFLVDCLKILLFNKDSK